jgi:hypothetical protein
MLETYHKLTSAINRAKDTATSKRCGRSRRTRTDSFCAGWADLDFSDEVEIALLRRLAQIGAVNLLASNLGKIIGSGPVSGSCRRPEYECTRTPHWLKSATTALDFVPVGAFRSRS